MSKVPKLRFPEFKGEWEEKELGEVGDIITGKTPSTKEEELWDGDILFVTPTDMNESKYQHSTERTVKKTDKMNVLPEKTVMVTCIASIGKMSLSTKPSITNQQINSIAPYKEISDNEFLYYAILKDIDKIKASQSSSTVPIINKTEFGKINIFIPLIEEQQKIADCLSSLDELIEARREKIASLKSYKKGLLQQLFPQEVCNNYPSHPLIFSKLPKLRFVGFEGEWEEVRLGEIGVFLSSLTGKTKEDFDKGNAKYIPYMNVYKNTFIDIQSLGKVNIREEEKQNVVKKGDILFTISSETPEEAGMSSVLADEIKDCYVNSFCSLFRFNSLSDKNIYFYGYLLRHRTIREYFRKTAQGSTRFNLSKESFKNLSLLVSKLGEQQKIADCLLSLDEKIAIETEQVVQLQQHKKGLLQQLLV